MKITITESQFTSYFRMVLDEMDGCSCDEIISESLTATDKNEIKSIVKKEIKDFLDLNRSSDFEKKVSDIVSKKFKNDKELEKHIVDITKNVLVQLYKSLWTKRNFWTNDLKNSPS
jgi:hypothetical protein